jgi:hypothetical protein
MPKLGLNKLKPDKDFRLGSIMRLPHLSAIPTVFVLGYPTVYDQKNSDFCGGAASAVAAELQENEPMSFEWIFAVAKKLSGDPVDSFGVDLRSICKAHTKVGALPRDKAPFSIDTHPIDFLRDIKNWPQELLNYAASNRKKTFFRITGPYSAFDNIRAAMYLHKVSAIIGVEFGWPLDQVAIDDLAVNGEGHAMAVLGWSEDYLIVRNSFGEDVGENGNHYIHRDVIDANVETYGAFIMLDMDREDVEWHIDNDIYMDDPWYTALFKVIKKLCGIKY